ncbi:MAG: M48 family metalloprotease [Desulfobacterales bacterium]
MQISKTICAVCLAATLVLAPNSYAITIEQEEKLGREFLKVVFKYYERVEDPLIVRYVQSVGAEIVSALPNQPFTYHFYVLNKTDYNAFASPAGHIFINSGLIEAMKNEEELAGIIAHEIAHVTSRHISQKIERGKKIGIGVLAGIAAGIFLGMAGSVDAAQALTMGSVAAGESIALSYSREDERQADQLGLQYLQKAGYDGKGLVRILKKMREQQWFGPTQVPTYLRTHPASEDRIAYLDSWIASAPPTAAKPESPLFLKTHTRLSALYGDEELARQSFSGRLAATPVDSMAHYGYGLLMARGGNRREAILHFRKALEQKAFDADILTELGKVYYLDGQFLKGLNTLKGAISIGPNNPESYFFLGRVQLELGQYQNAEDTFSSLLEKEPHYDEAYYFLGEAFGKRGDLGEAHYYLGLYYQKKDNLPKAGFHLNRALKKTTNPDTRQKIETALETIRKEEAERKKKGH